MNLKAIERRRQSLVYRVAMGHMLKVPKKESLQLGELGCRKDLSLYVRVKI